MVQTADGQAVHLLNATAAFVWERCDGSHPAARIAAELAQRTGESLARVAADVAAALATLRERGLLQ
ncbi:MAG: PqqD family protein [Gemmatimonadota bacterium]